jgi:hypothetical protein
MTEDGKGSRLRGLFIVARAGLGLAMSVMAPDDQGRKRGMELVSSALGEASEVLGVAPVPPEKIPVIDMESTTEEEKVQHEEPESA